jgi:hypothetical protein
MLGEKSHALNRESARLTAGGCGCAAPAARDFAGLRRFPRPGAFAGVQNAVAWLFARGTGCPALWMPPRLGTPGAARPGPCNSALWPARRYRRSGARAAAAGQR